MAKLKILVLTDFSSLAQVAMKYAARMSHTIDADYTIVNVVRVDGIPKSSMRLKTIERSILEASQQEGDQLIKDLAKNVRDGSLITFKPIKGHTVAAAVESFVKKYPTDLVVMGSQGASSLKKMRLGGTAVSVIESCPVPVLTVPKWAEFKNLASVAYASDLKNIQKEFDTILPFAKLFNSHIHMVHVVPSIDKKVDALRADVEKLIQKTGYSKIDFKVLIDDNIPQAIDGYIKSSKADLLTTFTHELTLYDKLFGLSVTRTLAYQGNIPLLAFKRKGRKTE